MAGLHTSPKVEDGSRKTGFERTLKRRIVGNVNRNVCQNHLVLEHLGRRIWNSENAAPLADAID
jgi:hypothetical protein